MTKKNEVILVTMSENIS